MIDGLSVLALITARGGSKGLPGKNIAALGGRPLIAWTIEAARGSRYVDRTVLSSDDDAIIAVALQHGAEVPFVRSAALASDDASSIDVVIDALDRLPRFDIVILLQPTSPLRSVQDIDAALDRLHSTGAPCCVSVRPAEEHPYWTFQLGEGGELRHFCGPSGAMPRRRQDLPPAWCLNGAVYAARCDWLRRERSFLGAGTVAQPMPAERSIDIDSSTDLERARALVANC
ncbi:MAG: cytidylyltransferase domain-containing protein [Betaproteobacteria bacterium]